MASQLQHTFILLVFFGFFCDSIMRKTVCYFIMTKRPLLPLLPTFHINERVQMRWRERERVAVSHSEKLSTRRTQRSPQGALIIGRQIGKTSHCP